MLQYAIVTLAYWAFTLTDGALRMLVVLHFHQLGYSPLDIASLFLFYEFFGVVTNLVGGWLAARLGLAAMLIAGLFLQIGALSMLLVDAAMLTVAYVMVAQALSGIAKDLSKMSAKSSVKLLADDAHGQLYRWVAALTGSKNALKGVGFFLGGALLGVFGFQGAIMGLVAALVMVAICTTLFLDRSIGRSAFKPRFRDVFSKSREVNWLSAARLFLFGSRDVWFVVALPVYLQVQFGWSSLSVGSLLAGWVVGYGIIQAIAPVITGKRGQRHPDGRTAVSWGAVLALLPVCIVLSQGFGADPLVAIVVGLLAYGAVFAVNSAVHSYLIVAYAEQEGVSLDVGFYYMSNALGRLLGTVLSGWVFQAYGFEACLWVSAGFVLLAVLISLALPRRRINDAP